MLDETLELCFKGDRDYLHGTDMYNSVVDAVHRCGVTIIGHRMAIHAIARNQCRLSIAAAGEPVTRPDKLVADFSFDVAAGMVAGFLTESADKVECRYPYDEERICALCSTRGGRIRINGATGYSPIEVIVAMTKHLHHVALKERAAKWAFTKLELSRALCADDATRIQLELVHNFNNRLTKSRIESGGAPLGHIYFSLWRS